MFPKDLTRIAARLVRLAARRNAKLAAAESCTGGLIAAALTEPPGASDCFAGGFVTYSNAMKTGLLGVPKRVLSRFGAVSAEAARAMAKGALRAGGANLAIAVTGIAGPGGGSKQKPVGLVYFATAKRAGKKILVRHAAKKFSNRGRNFIRLAATRRALTLLLGALGKG